MKSSHGQERAFEGRYRIDARAPLAGLLVAGMALILINFLPPVGGVEAGATAPQSAFWVCGTEAAPAVTPARPL